MGIDKVPQQYILIDPPYKAFYQDAFFDNTNTTFNRDGTLEPNARLRIKLTGEGKVVHTADFFNGAKHTEPDDTLYKYYSFGLLNNYEELATLPNVSLEAFFIMEPPVVIPQLYRDLPKLTKYFKRVYLHNTHGDGYSLKGIDLSKLHKLYYPMPYSDVLEAYWSKSDRLNRVVVINSNHNPILFALRGLSFKALTRELYSKRIVAICSLAKRGVIDLYGRRWNEWWSPFSMWLPYWKNRQTLMSVYHGSCTSKYEVLSQYKFCLCFENMLMDGYITEKIFDCMYAGTIPLYWGATDVQNLIPAEAYVDCSHFESWEQMWDIVSAFTEDQIYAMKMAGRQFIQSAESRQYINFLENVID